MVAFPGCLETYYFSTHGWSRFVSFVAGALEDEPFIAAASFRALMSKKFAIIAVVVFLLN
jgi:hypothetical protein